MQWDDGATPPDAKEIAIGWPALGDLRNIPSSRDAFKAALAEAYPDEKSGAVPVKAGVLFRFAHEITLGDVVVYPSRQDRLVNIGLVSGDYSYLPSADPEYPHRRRLDWKLHVPRAQFSQSALYEIGSAITLFQISNNADELIAALEGEPITALDVDADTAAEIAVQAEESIEDFVIKRLKNDLTPDQFEHFVAELLLRCMGYYSRVTSLKNSLDWPEGTAGAA